MAAEEHNFNSVEPLRHVEGLSSVSERVVRKKDQQQQQKHQNKGKRKGRGINRPVDYNEQQEENVEQHNNGNDEGHIDICA